MLVIVDEKMNVQKIKASGKNIYAFIISSQISAISSGIPPSTTSYCNNDCHTQSYAHSLGSTLLNTSNCPSSLSLTHFSLSSFYTSQYPLPSAKGDSKFHQNLKSRAFFSDLTPIIREQS